MPRISLTGDQSYLLLTSSMSPLSTGVPRTGEKIQGTVPMIRQEQYIEELCIKTGFYISIDILINQLALNQICMTKIRLPLNAYHLT